MDGDAMTVNRPDGKYTLFLNSTQPRIRHRFSVAHELAHILLTPILGRQTIHRRRFSKDQDPFGDQVEYLCNEMASTLLMPSGQVGPMLDSYEHSAICVPDIARHFDTSFEAASRRFIHIAKGRRALVVWNRKWNGALNYPKNTISNRLLGKCIVRFNEGNLSHDVRQIESRANQFASSKETIVLMKGTGRRVTRQIMQNTSVETFTRSYRSQSECWSFHRTRPIGNYFEGATNVRR